jgi:hypothetical protein
LGKPKKIKGLISFNREKEDNWELMEKAKKKKFKEEIVDTLLYLGYEWLFDIEIEETEKGAEVTIKTLNDIKIFDKEGNQIKMIL